MPTPGDNRTFGYPAIEAGRGEIDPRIQCPTSGEICPGLQDVVAKYDDHSAIDFKGLPDDVSPNLDWAKLQVRITEYAGRASLIGCKGPESSICPTRESMDDSTTRRTTITLFRRIRNRGDK